MKSCIACGGSLDSSSKRRKGYHLLHCKACGLVCVDPLPSLLMLEEYYSSNYVLASQVEHLDLEGPSPDTALLESWLRRFAPHARTVCEVGCSAGWLLRDLRELGYSVKGYELSATTSRIAREHFGLEVTTGEFTEQGEQFDVIIMRHVLEHVIDPVVQVNSIVKRLNPGGILILAVPNGGGMGSKILGQYWTWYCPPAHLWYFTSKSLKRLLDNRGMGVLFEMTRKGDAHNLFMELCLGSARWVRGWLNREANQASTVPQTPEKLSGQGIVRRSLSTITDWAYVPFAPLIDRVSLGDELWVIARAAK